jgi:ATP-dependent DNA helicase RecQ
MGTSPSEPNLATEQDRVLATFRQIWGYDNFRPPQGEIVRCLLSGRDALIIMPTGGGKSICFQLPALLRSGLTLVVSPLVALMENQVQELQQRCLPAALLHSEIPSRDRQRTLQQLPHLRLLYLSPETLLNPTVWQQLCQPTLAINGLVLDEAHCLVQWGDTFRPAYYRLGAVRSALLQTKPPGSRMAIAAFTATADPHAQQTIQRILRLQNPQTFRLNPYRNNLHLRIQTVWTPRQRRQNLLRFLRARPAQVGLVYVRTRQDSEDLANWLTEQGYNTAAYHAGLASPERRSIEQAWLTGASQFVVCTCAFGMGINKPDVRWVVHFHVPLLLSEYVQEIGRAGRDGHRSDVLALVSEPTGLLDPSDKKRQQFFVRKLTEQRRSAQQLATQLPQQGEVYTVSRQFKNGALALAWLHGNGQLQWQDPFHYTLRPSEPSATIDSLDSNSARQMTSYLHTRQCRWRYLLHSFGFAQEAATMRCGHCDNCQRSPQST